MDQKGASLALPYDIVEEERVGKGEVRGPWQEPRYVLLTAKVILRDQPAFPTEQQIRATLLALVGSLREQAEQGGKPVDGVSAHLFHSREHIVKGSSPLGLVEWWPKNHSFAASNRRFIEDKASYETTVSVLKVPKKQDEEAVVGRMSVELRRKIYSELAMSEQRADRESRAQHPIDESLLSSGPEKYHEHVVKTMDARFEKLEALEAKYRRELLTRHKITDEELRQILREAHTENWAAQ